MHDREHEIEYKVSDSVARTYQLTEWTIGPRGVPRTGETSLTDDELVLCDALFNWPASKELLLESDFNSMFNLPYGGFDVLPADLLESMQRRHLVEGGPLSNAEAPVELVRLTRDGSEMWEKERRPAWAAFCESSRLITDVGKRVRVTALNREVGKAFWEVGQRVGMWTAAGGDPVIRTDRKRRFPYWREVDLVILEGEVTGDEGGPVDWNVYERSRIWWRTVPELLRSHGALAGRVDSGSMRRLHDGQRGRQGSRG